MVHKLILVEHQITLYSTGGLYYLTYFFVTIFRWMYQTVAVMESQLGLDLVEPESEPSQLVGGVPVLVLALLL